MNELKTETRDNRHNPLTLLHLFMIQINKMTHTSRFQGNVRKQTLNQDVIASSVGKPPTLTPLHKVQSSIPDYIRCQKG